MSTDILESMTSTFAGPMLRQVSAFLDEPEPATRSAVGSIAPALLAGAMQKFAAPANAGELFRTLTSDTVDTGIAGRLSSILGTRGSLEPLLGRGDQIASALLGTRTGSATHAIAEVSGLKPNSVTALMSMIAPLLLGLLKKQVSQHNLDAGGLANLLQSQRGALERSGLDTRITSALGFSSLSSLLGSLPSRGALPGMANDALRSATSAAPAAADRARRTHWVPWAVAAGITVLGLMLWTSFSARNKATQTAEALGTPADTAVGDTASRLRAATLPANVYFEAGGANLGGTDRAKLAALASSVRADGSTVSVTGYTDRTGSPDQNLALAKHRASAVRDALIAEGVSESNVVLQPPAFVTGSGSDAEARRVEITAR